MSIVAIEIPKLTPKKLKAMIADPAKSAEAVNLVYVNDHDPGINRLRKGKGFTYKLENKTVSDQAQLKRIRSLVIPPAWENVWICKLPDGHLQATGLDKLKRKQYRYHNMWTVIRNHTKFFRLYEFGDALPTIRLQLEKDLSLPGLSHDKVLALVVSLMERTNIRVGNNAYEKLYGSFGLTTLKDQHVEFAGNKMKFSFKGKKGVHHDISITSKKLARLVKQCQDIPGKELFQFYNENGEAHTIDSGMVNAYLKKISGKDFTAKDFRTWAGTVQALLAFKDIGFADTATATKQNVVQVLDTVSSHLGNTRTVCKKYYVHPLVLDLYESRSLEKYLDELDAIEKHDNRSGLTVEEKLLMKILEKEAGSIKA